MVTLPLQLAPRASRAQTAKSSPTRVRTTHSDIRGGLSGKMTLVSQEKRHSALKIRRKPITAGIMCCRRCQGFSRRLLALLRKAIASHQMAQKNHRRPQRRKAWWAERVHVEGSAQANSKPERAIRLVATSLAATASVGIGSP